MVLKINVLCSLKLKLQYFGHLMWRANSLGKIEGKRRGRYPLPYINMYLLQVYMCSPSWTPTLLPPHTIPLSCFSAPAPSIQYHVLNETAEETQMYRTFYCLLNISIGIQLLYNIVLVSIVQQSELAIHIRIFPLFGFPSRLGYRRAFSRIHCGIQ